MQAHGFTGTGKAVKGVSASHGYRLYGRVRRFLGTDGRKTVAGDSGTGRWEETGVAGGGSQPGAREAAASSWEAGSRESYSREAGTVGGRETTAGGSGYQ